MTLALPALESLAAAAPRSRPVRRLVCVANPFGFAPDFYWPADPGPDYELTEYLQELAEFRGDLTLFQNFDHSLASGGHEGVDTYLSGIPPRESGRFAEANVSVDQKAAEHVAGATRFASLHGYVDGERFHGKTDHFSYSSTGLRRPQFSAAELFDQLFRRRSAADRDRIRDSLTHRNSVLDVVRSRARELRRRIGQEDRSRLDDYLTSVRELETQLQSRQEWLDRPVPETAYQIDEDLPGLRLLYDVLFLALQTDSTRVATLAISTHYHALTHHGNLPERVAQLHQLERQQFREYARFLGKLRDTDDPQNEGRMLDHTMVLFGAGMSDGASHSLKNLPLSIAGGPFHHGQQLIARRRTEACNIYLALLQGFGLEIERFNLSSGTPDGFRSRSA